MTDISCQPFSGRRAESVAGAVDARYNRGDDSYWQMIKPPIVEERVAKWADLKAAIKKE